MPSKSLRRTTLMAATAAAALALAGVGGAAEARVMSIQGGGEVNVNVSFNSQMPLTDMSDKNLMATQRRGRIFVYNMAKGECAILLSTIASSCRLAGLSVSAQVRNMNNNNPAFIYLNGNARYMIMLKDEGGGAKRKAKP